MSTPTSEKVMPSVISIGWKSSNDVAASRFTTTSTTVAATITKASANRPHASRAAPFGLTRSEPPRTILLASDPR